MEKQEIRALLKDVFIEKPCSVGWDNMTGDDKVRRCSQCNLNVHNLSSMSDREAAAVLKRGKSERTCVWLYRRKDGSVITDNCPTKLRTVRTKLCTTVAASLLALSYGISLSATAAGGLVGAAIDPAFSQTNEVGMLADYGYDTARDISRIITAISFIIVFVIPMNKKKKSSIRRVLLELIALTAIPILVHLAGTFMINNFGGLGGGGI